MYYDVPVKVHVDSDEKAGSAVLIQGKKDTYKVVSIVGKNLTITKQKLILVKQLLLIAIWAIGKLRHFTLFAKQFITVQLHSAEVSYCILRNLPLRV